MKKFFLYALILTYFQSFGQNLDSIAAFPIALNETSGLLYFNHKLITHNDSGGENALFEIDTITTSILRTVYIQNAINVDWEDLAQDENHIYIGDFGNNTGSRTDLKIYIVSKNDFETTTNDSISATILAFGYENQTSFTSQTQNTNFDAEAFIATEDSLYIFTKNWVNQETNVYSLPKDTGVYQAKLISSFNVEGMVTGADFNVSEHKIMLCGYTKLANSFLFEMKDFTFPFCFNGSNNRIAISPKGSVQIEGICATETNKYFLSSEKFITKPSVLHSFTDSLEVVNLFNEIILPSKIYPNPARNFLNIEGDFDFFEIYSSLGDSLLQSKNPSISIKDLPQGAYIIKCYKKNKLVKVSPFEKL